MNLITILGPTASGKTTFATHLAKALDAEIISADSRQIYRGMDIGTGKDLVDYTVDGVAIPYHLVDIKEAGYKYNVFEFQRDFFEAFEKISAKEKWPILCGGTGMYLESVLRGYNLLDVSPNQALRKHLKDKELPELVEVLESYKQLHNSSDTETPRRCIRAIEIADYYATHEKEVIALPDIKPLIIGVDIDRNLRREKITKRLKSRLEEGMIEEVKGLMTNGCSAGDLIYYGLEYKFVTQHILGELTFDEMFAKLEIAIHQFATRQMTWFRGMEKRGIPINWISAALPTEEKVELVKNLIDRE
ncbi:MAG: tRNA (adenosine(37)-N6)-dimethylallyltransferase MiaA [Bacteroidales bacterium]|jgi:tRNA dimethylallyltransferase|nr:tRNA (adenosine(37)-N6)-dimethylallyltransferase MiaA [Bacteroidales bacterium]